MKSIYPKSRRDRQIFWLSMCALATALIMLWAGARLGALVNGIVFVGNFALSYFGRGKQAPTNDADRYTLVISQTSNISRQLAALSIFLEDEKQRIQDAEAVVRRLNEERSALEPVVGAHRRTVEAILSAHAKRTLVLAWIERTISFGSGVVASVFASFLYELVRH